LEEGVEEARKLFRDPVRKEEIRRKGNELIETRFRFDDERRAALLELLAPVS